MNDIINENEVKTIHPRSVFVALAFSLISAGLGQVYNGQLKKGIIFILFFLLSPFILGLSGALSTFQGFVMVIIVYVMIRIYLIIDAIVCARRQKDYQKKKCNTPYYYLIFFIISSVSYWLFNTSEITKFQTFKVAMPSQLPTLKIGDYFAVDLQAYKNRKIDYGDLVIFDGPDGNYWTFRVVGLPGDRMELKDKFLIINGEQCKYRKLNEITVPDFNVSAYEYIEYLPNGEANKILISDLNINPRGSNISEFVIPEKNYFLMGDNRDNAMDSRFLGSVPEDNIHGQVVYIFWSSDKNRIGIDLDN